MINKKVMALFVMVIFFTGIIIPKASAETTFQAEKFPYQSMQVQVMPEFDYPEDWSSREVPSMLVGLYGTITNKTGQDYDGKIEVSVPADAKGFEANLVAEFPEENKPEVQRPFDVDKKNGVISWKPGKTIKNNATYKYVIEYYSKTIDVKDKKSFTYQFKSNSSIDQLDVTFYAPMNAKNIQIEPAAQENSKSDYGEELYFYQYTNVKAGEPLDYSFSYTKEGTESSMEAISKQQSKEDQSSSNGTATDQVVKSSGKSDSSQPIIGVGGASIIAIAIVILGVLIYLGLRGNSRLSRRGPKQRKGQQKRPISTKNNNKIVINEAKKELRKKLLTGKIDQETYEEEMKKLI